MKTITTPSDVPLPDYLKEHFDLSRLLFFDIETTGFSAKNTSLYLIGCLFFDHEQPIIRQWFAEASSEEATLLWEFFDFMKNYDYLIHYNGTGFDIPYLLQKCRQYNLPYTFDEIESIDLYKILSPVKSMLKLENLKQKTVENYLGIERNDLYNGGELIQVYQSFLSTPSEDAIEILLLHNHDDMNGLYQLSPMLAFREFNIEHFVFQNSEVADYVSYHGTEGTEVIFHFTLASSLPKKISFSRQNFFLSIEQNKCLLRIPAYTGELKYFYSDYKNYYYLPAEDTAIHKSVAFYVDKNFRTRAKAANCYSRKTGIFLPQFREIISPYFKIDYSDKTLYFEACESNLSDSAQILTYIDDMIKHMLK